MTAQVNDLALREAEELAAARSTEHAQRTQAARQFLEGAAALIAAAVGAGNAGLVVELREKRASAEAFLKDTTAVERELARLHDRATEARARAELPQVLEQAQAVVAAFDASVADMVRRGKAADAAVGLLRRTLVDGNVSRGEWPAIPVPGRFAVRLLGEARDITLPGG